MKYGNRKITTNWNLFFGSVGLVHAAIVGILFVPLYLNYLGVELWGQWLALGSIFILLSSMDLGINQGLLQRIGFNFASDETLKVGEYFRSGIIIISCLSLLILITGCLFYFVALNFLPQLNFNGDLTWAYFIAVIIVPINLFNNFLVGVQVATLKPFLISLVQSLCLVLSVIFQFFGLYLGYGLLSLVLPNLVFFSVALVIGLYLNRTYIFLIYKEHFNKAIFLDCIGITRDLSIPRLLDRIASGSYPMLISIASSPELVVAFTICRRAGEFALRIINMLRSTIIYPMINARASLSKFEFSLLLAQANRIFVFLSLLSFFTYLVLNEYFVYLWVGENQFLGIYINVLLTLTLTLQSLKLYVHDLLIMEGMNKIFLHQGLLGILVFIIEVIGLFLFGIEIMLFSNLFFGSFVLIYGIQKFLIKQNSLYKITYENILKSRILRFIALSIIISIGLMIIDANLIVSCLSIILFTLISIKILSIYDWIRGYLGYSK